jgi:hypothetical protein
LVFPLDYWNNDNIQNAIASFGRVLLWENDRTHLTRLMVKARVTDLQEVPYFIVLTGGEGFQGQSWTIQCEILEQQLLGALSADEDPMLELHELGHPPLFDFFGLDQPAQGNVHHPQIDLNENAIADEDVWDAWGPEEEDIVEPFDLNVIQPEIESHEVILDLNMAPPPDPDEALNQMDIVAFLPAVSLQENLPVEQQHQQEAPLGNHVLNLAISVEINPIDLLGDNSEGEVSQPSVEENYAEIVLALPAATINYLHLEILPEELNAVVSDEQAEGPSHDLNPNVLRGQVDQNLQPTNAVMTIVTEGSSHGRVDEIVTIPQDP